jgi:hypothetical protein
VAGTSVVHECVVERTGVILVLVARSWDLCIAIVLQGLYSRVLYRRMVVLQGVVLQGFVLQGDSEGIRTLGLPQGIGVQDLGRRGFWKHSPQHLSTRGRN